MNSRLESFMDARAKESYPEPRSEGHDQITAQMAPMVAVLLPTGGHVLDVGSGHGPALEWFSSHGFAATGIDVNSENILACVNRGFYVTKCDQNRMPDSLTECYDCVWARHVLEHSIAPFFTLSEFARVLKPGGILYVEVPAPDTACQHEINRNHYSVMGRYMLEQLIIRAGFVILEPRTIQIMTQAGEDKYFSLIARKNAPVSIDSIALHGLQIDRADGWEMEPVAPLLYSTLANLRSKTYGQFRYFEIGIARLGTIVAIQKILAQLPGDSIVYGNELPSDPWNTRAHISEVLGNSSVQARIIYKETPDAVAEIDGPLNYVFIDACHCFEHVKADFEAVEGKVAPGGLVAFHDTAIASQDKFPQWDGKPVQVRRFLEESGLLGNARPDWCLVSDDKYNGVGLTIFERQ